MDKTIHSAEYAIFLKVFRDVRQKSGLTQIDLAEKIGESQSFVSKCERGERRIDLIELRAFCDPFGVTLREFISRFEKMIGKQRPAKT